LTVWITPTKIRFLAINDRHFYALEYARSLWNEVIVTARVTTRHAKEMAG